MLRRVFLYFSDKKRLPPWLMRFATSRKFASRFVAGETLGEAVAVTRKLNAAGRLITLDRLGENVGSSAEAAAAREAYKETLAEIHRSGLRSSISIKLTQLGLDLSERECASHLLSVVEFAEQTGSFVRVDMEGSAYTSRTLALVAEIKQTHSSVGAVIQAYLYRSQEDLNRMIASGISLRLCKGAYNEPPSVAFPRKADVDKNYVRLMRVLLSSGTYHAIATHDPKIIDATCQFARERNLGTDAFEFQMLYGIRTDLQERLVREGYRLRVYVPFGREWFPYFMRRLAERPANVWFVLKNLFR